MQDDPFGRNGFIIERAFISADKVELLRQAVESARPRCGPENPLTLGGMRFKSNLFYESARIQQFLRSEPVVRLLSRYSDGDLWARWDQAVWKQPGAPQFPWHQDNGYSQLDDVHLQLWVALTPSRRENGGLVVAPGQHVQRLRHEWVGDHATINDPPGDSVAIDAAAGDVVLFSSMLPHMTTPNHSDDVRVAYVVEFLPLRAADLSVRPPHLVVSRRGRPVGQFEDLCPTWSRECRLGSL